DRAHSSTSKRARRCASKAEAPSSTPFLAIAGGHPLAFDSVSPCISWAQLPHWAAYVRHKPHAVCLFGARGNHTLSGVGPEPISRNESNVMAKNGQLRSASDSSCRSPLCGSWRLDWDPG